MVRVVCAGHVNWDVTLRMDRLPEPDGEASIDGQHQSGGGSASNTAAVLSGLGHESVLLGSVGDDEYGRLAQENLEDAGVECEYLRTARGETTVKYLLVAADGQVMVLANDGLNEAFEATDLPPAELSSADHLHLTGQRPETALALAERGVEAGISVSFAPGRRLDERDYAAVIEHADLLFCNEREAEVAAASGLLEHHDGPTVVTDGEGGARIRDGDGTVGTDGHEVDAVDTAGAGDAFAAGFLSAWLEGSDAEESLAVGNACGALAVQSVGARTAITREDVAAYRS